jgi:hypothetical protein
MSHPILITGASRGTQGSTGRLVAGLLLKQALPFAHLSQAGCDPTNSVVRARKLSKAIF